MFFHFSLSWAVTMASDIVSPSFSLIVFVILVFCRPRDRLQNTTPVSKSFSVHLCLIMCPTKSYSGVKSCGKVSSLSVEFLSGRNLTQQNSINLYSNSDSISSYEQ